jgi:hypothetical protein
MEAWLLREGRRGVDATSRRKLPWGLIGAIATAIVIESVLARHDLDLSRPEALNWRWGRAAATRNAPGCDVLCFGTSMVQEAVFPRVVEQRSGLRTFNLAVCAGRGQVYYYYLKRALADGSKPSAVVVDFHPSFITSPYTASLGWPDALGFADCLDMAWNTRDSRFLATNILAKTVPSYYYRPQVRAGVLAALRGEPSSARYNNILLDANIKRNRGALIVPRNPSYRGEISEGYRQSFLADGWRCDPDEHRAIHKFLDLAAAHGIRVYWLVVPLCPALQAAREQKGLDAIYSQFVRSFQGYPNLVVLDARRSGYDASVFLDASHLDLQGAFVLSRDIADVLRHDAHRKFDGTRWVSVPPYRALPIDVPLEQIPQTALALKNFANRRR